MALSPKIKTSVFNFCFILYMVVSSAVVLMFCVFLFLDDNENKNNIYSHVIVFLLGTWSSFMVVKGQKSHTHQVQKIVESERADRKEKDQEVANIMHHELDVMKAKASGRDTREIDV